MKIANKYNHLNAEEYLLCRKPEIYQEIQRCIESINANHYLKLSCDTTHFAQVFYSQGEINKALAQQLNSLGWYEHKIYYYVTSDENTTREVVNVFDKEEQKGMIVSGGFPAYLTNNQVDFQKDRVAMEIQFGKYFSVAYDLHVKHTFFYMRNDIDVGVEVIPTKALEEHMDTGVAWFENEVTNVIREGRTNPVVPILLLGIEPENLASRDPCGLEEDDLVKAIENSDMEKYRSKLNGLNNPNQIVLDRINRVNAYIRYGENQDDTE